MSFHSPVGDLTLSEDDGAIVSLDWGWAQDQGTNAPLREAHTQLMRYFDGAAAGFDLVLKPPGTPFQNRVWTAMTKIPYGGTQTYGQIATALSSSARAVGTACGANPIPIVIPCHRIVAASGLGGYSGEGGLETKQWLLNLEGWRG
jgi:methylated-DNA-[protein]-cysteine S-methyltransferase